jgi:uncharacterized protein YjbJ (UPF0337 family)
MDSTADLLFGRWIELKGQVKKHWRKITLQDLTRLNGKTEELAVILQERYGYGRIQAEREIIHWLNNRRQREKK